MDAMSPFAFGFPAWWRRAFEAATRLQPDPAGVVEKWFHPDQIRSVVRGHVILKHLEQAGLLDSCFDEFHDLEALRAGGTAHFLRNYAGLTVFAWKSASRRRGVPSLYEMNGKLWTLRRSLDNHWSSIDPALRHIR